MKLRTLLLLCMIAVVVARGAVAQPAPGDTRTPPVAVVSLVWGVVTLKHQDADYAPARWLNPIYPGDLVKTAGPGSKLLITYFFDNHQEVIGPDSEARVDPTTLTSLSGDPIRKDRARNPFGSGVQNPFVYTHYLVSDDFKGADAPDAMQQERAYLQATVRSNDPVTFTWLKATGASPYQLSVLNASGGTVLGVTTRTPSVKLAPRQANKLFTGTVYSWQVTTPGNATVVPNYDFMYLSVPQKKWYNEIRGKFENLRKRNQLQRSDYTDYLLVSSQLVRVDDVVSLCREMAKMNPNNPDVFRALTRAYLAKGCPAHAREAHAMEIQLGGVDPVYP